MSFTKHVNYGKGLIKRCIEIYQHFTIDFTYTLSTGPVNQYIVYKVQKQAPNEPFLFQVSMLGPSPDWIVGVSGLELCRTNCSWAENKELFLYPWDAGVDSGISYESPDSPTDPQLPITRSEFILVSCLLAIDLCSLKQRYVDLLTHSKIKLIKSVEFID